MNSITSIQIDKYNQWVGQLVDAWNKQLIKRLSNCHPEERRAILFQEVSFFNAIKNSLDFDVTKGFRWLKYDLKARTQFYSHMSMLAMGGNIDFTFMSRTVEGKLIEDPFTDNLMPEIYAGAVHEYLTVLLKMSAVKEDNTKIRMYSEADYVAFVIHYEKIVISKNAEETKKVMKDKGIDGLCQPDTFYNYANRYRDLNARTGASTDYKNNQRLQYFERLIAEASSEAVKEQASKDYEKLKSNIEKNSK